MNLDAIRRDERGRPDPQSAADCIAHCTAFMTSDECEIAVLLIDLLIQRRVGAAVIDAVKDCYSAVNRILDNPITAAEVAKAEETPQ
jgi:hypothetical protein